MSFLWKAFAGALALTQATSVYATNYDVTEIEPNNSFATAQQLPFGLGGDLYGSTLVRGSFESSTPGFQDYYSFDFVFSTIRGITANQIYVISYGFNLDTGVHTFDPLVMLYRADGSVVSNNATNVAGHYVLGLALPAGSTDYGYRFVVAQITAPEPSTWALMLAGFGMIGYALRRRRVSVVLEAMTA